MKLAWWQTLGCPADVAANLATLELTAREAAATRDKVCGRHAALHAIRRRQHNSNFGYLWLSERCSNMAQEGTVER
jgi:hypothetical protein